MFLTLSKLFGDSNTMGKLLHVAPEACLQPWFKGQSTTYHTSDLFRDDVDFNEDLQRLSFPAQSYDSVIISRVLTIPEKLEACLDEASRILKPGGMACIAETFTHAATLEFHPMKNGRSREIGLDFLQLLERHFDQVDLYDSDQFDPTYQLINRMEKEGITRDNYPERVRAPGMGFKEIVAICRKK